MLIVGIISFSEQSNFPSRGCLIVIKRGCWRRIPFRESPLLETQARATPNATKVETFQFCQELEDKGERLSSAQEGARNYWHLANQDISCICPNSPKPHQTEQYENTIL